MSKFKVGDRVRSPWGDEGCVSCFDTSGRAILDIDKNRKMGWSDDQLTLISTLDAPTLRDQFAMAALTGLLARDGIKDTRENFVKKSYDFANAMLAAREVK